MNHISDFLLLASLTLAACAISANLGWKLASSNLRPLAEDAVKVAREATTGHAVEMILRHHMEKRHKHELALCHERIQYLLNEVQNLQLLNIPAVVVPTPEPKKKAGKRANASGLK